MSGKCYLFASEAEMLKGIKTKEFIEYGFFEGNIYGIKFETIRKIMNGVLKLNSYSGILEPQKKVTTQSNNHQVAKNLSCSITDPVKQNSSGANEELNNDPQDGKQRESESPPEN